MGTNSLSAKSIQRKWLHVDAKGKVLGRLATKVANVLMGKNKVNYVPYLDAGDFIVITNAEKVKLTGKKLDQKKYYNHSGYPGGLRIEDAGKLIKRRPEKIIEHAVWGMMPKTKLGKKMIRKLHVFAGETNPYKDRVEELK